MSETPSVPLSRTPETGTTGHCLTGRDIAGTPCGTLSLKALAAQVLRRDTQRDMGKLTVPDGGASVGQFRQLRHRVPVPSASALSMCPGAALWAERSADSKAGRDCSWGKAEEERAAIIEHDGNITRAWAEGIARLDPDRPPGDVPLKRWQTFIDDCGRFLDAGWAAKAAVFGWGPLDLFGCDRERPFARVGHAGLLWLLNGDKLVEFGRHAAVIEKRTGTPQTFRRRPHAVGEVVLAWELAAEPRKKIRRPDLRLLNS